MLAVVIFCNVAVAFADSGVLPKFHYAWSVSGVKYELYVYGDEVIKVMEARTSGVSSKFYFASKRVFNYQLSYTLSDGTKLYRYGKSSSFSCNTYGDVAYVDFLGPYEDSLNGFNPVRKVADLTKYASLRESDEVQFDRGETDALHLASALAHDKWSEIGKNSEWSSEAGENLLGSQDNPISDENIGTLVLKKSKCYWVKDGSMDVSQRVQWANKTDTDFSLTNNKYAITRIEVKIGNRVTYFGDVEHHGKGKKVDNFGEVYPFKYVIATDNPHDFSFKDMLSASKTDLAKYNAAMLEHEYDLYFRVVCGTAYGTSAEWHCGNWTRYRVTDDPKQDGKNESDNGHFNDNGEWEKDKDTDVDSGGIGNVDDKDDLEDDFNHFKDSENWKDWLNKEGLDLDSAKAFIDQVADVPKMIGDLFSFFPDWVKYSFAFGFGLIPVIIVIKFLRG